MLLSIKSPDFEASSVMWNDEWPSMFPPPYNLPGPPKKEGTFPDGSYESDKHMKIEFCCRQDGFVENGIHLPLGKILIIQVNS